MRLPASVLAALLTAAVTGGLPGDALADESVEAPRQHWYGYQTLILDGAASILLPIGIVLGVHEAQGDNIPAGGLALGTLGTMTYLFGGPIVHWAHGHVGIGFLSLGLRILAPIAGLGLGAVGSEIANGSKTQIGIPIGAAVGALAAMGLDGAVFGWEKPSTKEPAAEATFLPGLVLTRQTIAVGVTSHF